MTKPLTFLARFCLSLVAIVSALPAADSPRPNVLWIVVDGRRQRALLTRLETGAKGNAPGEPAS